MASIVRSSILRSSRTVQQSTRTFTTTARQSGGTDYGSKQSGYEQGINKANPMKHLEHPGPESPVASGQVKGSDTSGASQTESKGQQSGGGASSGGSSAGKPTIQKPYSAAEDQDPEVRKHNEEMRNRADRSVNQLEESDNKVDKNFWKGEWAGVPVIDGRDTDRTTGDVGDIKSKDS